MAGVKIKEAKHYGKDACCVLFMVKWKYKEDRGGTPTWWYTMAPAVKTFLEDNDFSGKTVIPFMTNGGWPGHVIKDMTAAVKGAKVEHPMQIQFDSTGGSRQETSQDEVDSWIKSI